MKSTISLNQNRSAGLGSWEEECSGGGRREKTSVSPSERRSQRPETNREDIGRAVKIRELLNNEHIDSKSESSSETAKQGKQRGCVGSQTDEVNNGSVPEPATSKFTHWKSLLYNELTTYLATSGIQLYMNNSGTPVPPVVARFPGQPP